MIKEYEFYHGVVFTRIMHVARRPLSLRPYESPSNASYVLNNEVGIYVKHSTKRLSPWRFTFLIEHQEEIDNLRAEFQKVFLLLVCYDDGVVCISYDELKQILDDHHDPVEWISVSRQKRKMYTVNGSNGRLKCKIGKNDFPDKLFK